MESIKTILKKDVKKIIVIGLIIFSSCNAEGQLLVRYSIISSNTGSYANITYKIGDKSVTLTNQELPWEYEFKLFTTSTSKECYYLELTGEKVAADASTMTLEISYWDKDRFMESFSDNISHNINDTPCVYAVE
jgi:hypothetical protein